MSEPTRRWKDVLAEEPVNEAQVLLYERLMESQERIAQALHARGIGHEVIANALDAAEERLTEAERQEDLYLAALSHYVEALGGRLEVRAIFGDDAVLV